LQSFEKYSIRIAHRPRERAKLEVGPRKEKLHKGDFLDSLHDRRPPDFVLLPISAQKVILPRLS
jgi:hypothetical protein